MKCAAVFTNQLSDVSSFTKSGLLKTATINSKLFNRNTNVAGYENQKGGTCYAHAASSAYLNSCAAVYPQNEWPSWEECLKEAIKGTDGGKVSEALERLEEKFNMGIEWKELKKGEFKIRDVLMTSIVICFHTTKQGFFNISSGKLTKKPFGILDQVGHATLIEAYNFESECYICKNSWGDLNGSEPRFQLKLSALHDYTIYQVHWTSDSLKKKNKPVFEENYGVEETEDIDGGYKLQTRQMDKKTAIYSTKYICQRKLVDNNEVWVGYDVDKVIEMKQQSTPKLESTKVPQTNIPQEYTYLNFAISEKAKVNLMISKDNFEKDIVRWTVGVKYGDAASSFAIGAIPCTSYDKCNKSLDEVVGAMTFSFTNKDKTMSSSLSGIREDFKHAVHPRETMVEHTSTVSIEVDCNKRIISFFVDDVKVPHVIADIVLPLHVGMSVAWESDVLVTPLSLCRLSSSTPSNVKLTMHTALFPADLAKERERMEREMAEREAERVRRVRWRVERERLDRENAERERANRERLDRENAERERAKRERLDRENAEREMAKRERLDRENAERERAKREQDSGGEFLGGGILGFLLGAGLALVFGINIGKKR